MDSVLIVSNTNTTLGIVSDLLASRTFSKIVTTQSGSESRRSLINDDFELIIIDTPLSDEYGDDFALHAAEATSAGIILIAKPESLYDMNEAVEDLGVFVLPKPVSPEFFYQAVKLLYSSRKRVLKLQHENKDLQNKLQEIRIIDRAKYILMQYLNMTEPQAHRYIEKQAMDLRQSRLVTAENILKTYDIDSRGSQPNSALQF
jgi:response regulator NasT